MDPRITLTGDDHRARPCAFPRGELLHSSDRLDAATLREIDRLLEEGECREGRLEVAIPDTRLTALIHLGAPYMAGLQEGAVFSRVPLCDFALRAGELPEARCRLERCDNAVVLMTAVHFSKRPSLKGSVKLVNPAHVLRVLAQEGRDAAMALERDGRRTLLFLHAGLPARLIFGDPEDDPGKGNLEERLLSWAFESDSPETMVEVFHDLTVTSDPDAGTAFAELAKNAQPAPPALMYVHIDGREVRRRPFSPPEMVIGRDPKVDLFIDNLGVSRRHASVSWHQGRFVVTDLGSSNGTFVDGQRVESAAVLPLQRIEIGKFEVTIVEHSDEIQVPETVMIPSQPAAIELLLVGEGQRVPLNGDLLVGKGEGVDLMARGWGVGPVHARLHREGDDCVVRGLGRHKISVEGERTQNARLSVGDELEIGRSRYRLVVAEPGEADS